MRLEPLYRLTFRYPEEWGIAFGVVTVTHMSDHPRYTWMNDSLSVGCGEVRRLSDEDTELVIDVRELIWEPIGA
jgi:hypothetical protein